MSLLGAQSPSGPFHLRAEFPRSFAGFGWASGAAPNAWLEWEVKPLGIAFDGSGIHGGTPHSLTSGTGTLTFEEAVSVDDASGHARTTRARSYHWRVRVATNDPLFPGTAWFGIQGNNVTEAKLRKSAIPTQ